MSGIFDTLVRDTDKVVSIVGGGGKTSLMFLLAHAFQGKGQKVVTTTTTRILIPTKQQSANIVLFADDVFEDKLQDCLDLHGHATVAHHLLPEGNKLKGISCTQIEQINDFTFVDRIVIEADGARQLSFKAAGDNEPVVPKNTDLFISVVGLDIIGKSLDDENVFRAELVSSRTGLGIGEKITALTVAKLAVHPQGLLEGCPDKARSCIVLNKVDIRDGKQKALSVIEAAGNLAGIQPDSWISTSISSNIIFKKL